MARPEPRWLDPDELQAWIALSRLAVSLPGALDTQLQRDSELSFFEYMVLAMLTEQPHYQIRMSELAALANGSLSRLSHVARRLESRGLIRREPDPTDGRFTIATITQSGLATVKAAAPGHVDEVRALVIDALTSAQLRQLRTIADRVLERVDPDSKTAPRVPE